MSTYIAGRQRAVCVPSPITKLSRLALARRADDEFPDVDGTSPEISVLKQHMLRVAHDPFITVLISGESGTGKERVASAIHRASARRTAPFIVVNCAGLSSTLVEDQLFGHMRGAFTGAMADQAGPFERADGGTVFLDEVGELTPDVQIKLLRALQQRRVQRLGGQREAAFDVRVIAATHVDLCRAVAQGRFREDLYYRLKVYELRVPPLHRRGMADLETLATTILTNLAGRRHRPPAMLAPAVLEEFTRYRWPGNVRELENTLERMMVAAGSAPLLTCEYLPPDFGTASRSAPSTVARTPVLSTVEIQEALERNRQLRGRTAEDLGLSRHQFYRLLKRRDASSANASA